MRWNIATITCSGRKGKQPVGDHHGGSVGWNRVHPLVVGHRRRHGMSALGSGHQLVT
jgi:hypothetical protein